MNGKEGRVCGRGEDLGSQELTLRSWKEGDAFMPLGMKSKKKISDFFVDEKIPVYEKPHIPILETKDGDIVWVCGCRIDDRFKVTRDNAACMKLQFSTSEKDNGTQQEKRSRSTGDIFVVMLSERRVRSRVKSLATKISKDYKATVPVFIGILNGSFIFFADLIREVTHRL